MGSAISQQLGLLDPEHMVGLHLNTLGRAPSGDPDEMALLTDTEKGYLEAAARFTQQGFGYFMIQSSRPQTLAYGLTDSPVGLLAWIAEKFKEWTDSTNFPEDAIDRDQLLNQRDHLLADADRQLLGSPLLRIRPRRQFVGQGGAVNCADRGGGVPSRDRTSHPALRRAIEQRRALVGVQPWRSLRRHGRT